MKHEKIYEGYKKTRLYSPFIFKFNLVRAYYRSNDSIIQLVYRILRDKYNQDWQDNIIKNVLEDARGKRNPVIDIPQFNYKENVEAIFDKFIENKFDKMVNYVINHGLGEEPKYPLEFRNIIEKYSDS
jgi:hypothetical protein